jgi:hypothetical protein
MEVAGAWYMSPESKQPVALSPSATNSMTRFRDESLGEVRFVREQGRIRYCFGRSRLLPKREKRQW